MLQVTSPQKVGEGMSSYMVYNVVTRTNINYFRKKEMSVNRRFSDFLGLHDKLSEKYLQNGRIIPPAPDKSVVGMTKVKMSKDVGAGGGGEAVQDEVRRVHTTVHTLFIRIRDLSGFFQKPSIQSRKNKDYRAM